MGKFDHYNKQDSAPENEASKLLEAALLQMDGIISGNTGSLTAHSPDYGFASSPPGIREAANTLANAIQSCPAAPVPEPGIARTLLAWIQAISDGFYPFDLDAALEDFTRAAEDVERHHHYVQSTAANNPPNSVTSSATSAYSFTIPEAGDSAVRINTVGYLLPSSGQRKRPPPPPPPPLTHVSNDITTTAGGRDNANVHVTDVNVDLGGNDRVLLSTGGDGVGKKRVIEKGADEYSDETETSSDEDEDEVLMNEGLETITEEERVTSGLQTSEDEEETSESSSSTADDRRIAATCGGGGGGNKHSNATTTDKSGGGILKCDNNAGWVELDEEDDGDDDDDRSSSDMSSDTCSDKPVNSKDSSTRCNSDFQWIPKDITTSPTLCDKPPTIMVDDTAPPTQSKPPINRSSTSTNQPAQPAATHSHLHSHHHHREKVHRRRSATNLPPVGPTTNAIIEPHHNGNNIVSAGSLDRRRGHMMMPAQQRHERDQKTRSVLHVKSPPPRLDEFVPVTGLYHNHHAYHPQPPPSYVNNTCQNWCCNNNTTNPQTPLLLSPQGNNSNNGNLSSFGGGGGGSLHGSNSDIMMETFHRRHERMDPQRYGSSPMLMEGRYHHGGMMGSHPDIYGDCGGRFRGHDMQQGYGGGGGGGCCAYHVVPPPPQPCCYYGEGRGGGSRGYHWAPPPLIKPPDVDEKCRKLQSERDNLQLQVQVLSEQIDAQSDKISDLEKILAEKKHMLANAEDLLQRETLSRSSLETQKLELISQISEMKLHQASLERENMELRATCHQYNNNGDIGKKPPPYLSRMSPQPLTSTPIHHNSSQALNNMRVSPSPSPVTTSSVTPTARRIENTSVFQQDAQSPKTPPGSTIYKRQIELHYASLPRQQYLSSNGTSALSVVVDANANPAGGGGKRGVAFGRGLSSLLGGRAKGHSVPNLAETEKIVIDDLSANSQQESPVLQFNKNQKGIKKIFGRMKRSGSGNLEDLPAGLGEFQRGGVRATATARLGWSEPQIAKNVRPSKPFAEWDTENLCAWLQELGLEQYVEDGKNWLKTGQQLQETSINEIEKELQIKNALHRKKLQLALIDVEENSSSDPYLSQAGKLDTAWVLRWLDDTGMPQHKDMFLSNAVDGRVLHRLTMDDLAMLHVTSLLHVASLKRGIQVLRENNYDGNCLQRRSLPDDDKTERTLKEVCLWSTHRVMEWLREVDLAEYAPNLRGAGVHGAIMVLENKFTSELLATLLSIPPSKTLLRRHLNTHFKDLLGKDLIQTKREAEATLGYIPLTPAAKLKVPKKSHFSLKRSKSKSEADYGDLVCPMNAQSGELNGSALNSTLGMMKMIRLKEEDVSHLVDDDSLPNSYPQSATNSPLPLRYESS